MKELRNEVCPRVVNGAMLEDRSVCGEKRRSSCIAKIMHKMEAEFDESDLKGVQEKAISFIAKNSLRNKRLRNLINQDWGNMRSSDKAKNVALKQEMELCYERWSNGPYGCCQLIQGMLRQHTSEELNVILKRNFDAKTTTVLTIQYVLFLLAYEIIMPLLCVATKFVDTYITYIAS